MSNLHIVTVKAHSNSQNKIFLGPQISANFIKGESITIHYGLEQVQAKVVPIKHKNLVAFSQDIWNRLSFPFPHKVHASVYEKRILIGPLVGIMVSEARPHPTRPLGDRTGFIQKYITSQKDVPSSYFVFTPTDISTSTKRVAGYFLFQKNGKRTWRRFTVPFPSVVYNRVFRKGEKTDYIIKGKSILEEAGTKIFNPFTFNKWNIHELIHNRADVQNYLPESHIHPSLNTLNTLLQKYNMVYLKPTDGYQGLGIIQISKSAKKGLLCRFNHQEKNHVRLYPNMKTLIKHRFKGRSLKNYIAQQGIPLLHYHGRTIDFRVHVNKDQSGNWKMTGAAAKMAGKGSVTTHIRTGGHVLTFEKAVSPFFTPEKCETVFQNMKTAALSLAHAIEQSLPGYVGEIAFDIGIDLSGHPWMFEANSQPGRHIFAIPSLKESEVLTRRNILDYSLYLAGFTNKEVTMV